MRARVRPEALWRRHVKFTSPLEARFARDYRSVMGDLREAVRNTAKRPFNLAEWQAKVVDAMAPAYRSAIAAGGRQFLLGTKSIREKVANGIITKAKRDRAGRVVVSLERTFSKRISDTVSTTFDALQSVLAEAVSDKLDSDEVADLIDEEWNDILGARTDGIALTETNGAVNSVRDYLMHEIAELQSWVNAKDERVRLTHVIYAEATPKPVGFNYATLADDADYTLRFACDPECSEPAEIINCRCFMVPDGEMELAPEELKDYLAEFDMRPEDMLLSEEQAPQYVTNRYEGKSWDGEGDGDGIHKGEAEGHPFRGNQYQGGSGGPRSVRHEDIPTNDLQSHQIDRPNVPFDSIEGQRYHALDTQEQIGMRQRAIRSDKYTDAQRDKFAVELETLKEEFGFTVSRMARLRVEAGDTRHPERLSKGDLEGHPFRGNQYTDVHDIANIPSVVNIPSYGTPTPGSVSVIGHHFSQKARPVLDSTMSGSGIRGEEDRRLKDSDPRLRQRLNFYVDQGQGIKPEHGVGNAEHVVKLNNLYNPERDGFEIWREGHGDLSASELAVIRHGYDGYYVPSVGQAVLLGPHSIETGARVSKGDLEGHPFRGNQWTDVFGQAQDDPDEEFQREEPASSDYASDPDDVSQHPGAHPRMPDEEYQKQNDVYEARVKELGTHLMPYDAAVAALKEQSLDFVSERMMRDDRIYRQVRDETALAWQSIGGSGPVTLRLAANEAFGVEGAAFDKKLGRFVTDPESDYPGSTETAKVWAGALRREYAETQQEIANGFEFTIAGEGEHGDIDYDALGEMETEAWSGLSDSEKADYIPNKVDWVEYALAHEEDWLALARDGDPDGEPKAVLFAKVGELAKYEDPNVATVVKFLGASEDDAVDSVLSKFKVDTNASPGNQENVKTIDDLEKGNNTPTSERVNQVVADAERAIATAEKIKSMDPQFSTHEGESAAERYHGYLDGARASVEAFKALPADATREQLVAALRDVSSYGGATANVTRMWSDKVLEGVNALDIDPSHLDARDDYTDARDSWLDPYAKQLYAQNDPDGLIFDSFVGQFQPDEYPYLEAEGDDIRIDPDKWPLELNRTVTADVTNYTPNAAESWSYDMQHFGSSAMTEKVDPARVLVFQGADNWSTPKGENSMGSQENEFILLAKPPKFVLEARARGARVAAGKAKDASKRVREAKIDALMQKYRQLQRLQDFGTSEQHEALKMQIANAAGALGLELADLVDRAREAAE